MTCWWRAEQLAVPGGKRGECGIPFDTGPGPKGRVPRDLLLCYRKEEVGGGPVPESLGGSRLEGKCFLTFMKLRRTLANKCLRIRGRTRPVRRWEPEVQGSSIRYGEQMKSQLNGGEKETGPGTSGSTSTWEKVPGQVS